MSKIKDLLKKYKEIITYIIFGVLTTALNLAAFHIFNMIIGSEYYLISNSIAWLIAVVFAYVTNKLFVFESKSWKSNIVIKEMLSFFAARILSFFVEEIGLFVFVDLLNFKERILNIFSINISGEMIAKVVLAIIVVILNYIFSKLYIFKKKA